MSEASKVGWMDAAQISAGLTLARSKSGLRGERGACRIFDTSRPPPHCGIERASKRATEQEAKGPFVCRRCRLLAIVGLTRSLTHSPCPSEAISWIVGSQESEGAPTTTTDRDQTTELTDGRKEERKDGRKADRPPIVLFDGSFQSLVVVAAPPRRVAPRAFVSSRRLPQLGRQPLRTQDTARARSLILLLSLDLTTQDDDNGKKVLVHQ